MNQISVKQQSSTYSRTVVMGLFAATALFPLTGDIAQSVQERKLLRSSYTSKTASSTFNSTASSISGQYQICETPFEQSVTQFYTKLLASQEPLGTAFEKVLYDNLWDLYES